MNKVFLIGHLGKKPELKYLDDRPMCSFSLATSKTIQGQKKTTWHRVVVFGKSAEACANNLDKGSKVFVEGEISKREYTDKQGFPKQSVDVVSYGNVMFLSDPKAKTYQQTEEYEIDDEVPF